MVNGEGNLVELSNILVSRKQYYQNKSKLTSTDTDNIHKRVAQKVILLPLKPFEKRYTSEHPT